MIDAATHQVSATLPVGRRPRGVAVDPSGTRVCVANTDSDDISVIDAETNTVVATVAVGADSTALGDFIDPILAPDTVPPTTVVTSSAGPDGGITVTLTAADNPGGSGVRDITFSFAGTVAGSGVVSGGTVSMTIFENGTATLTYFARDNAGNREAIRSLDIRIDGAVVRSQITVAPGPGAPRSTSMRLLRWT